MDVLSLNQQFIRELLDLYKNLPAVWKMKSKEYKNKPARAQAYALLVQKCREYVPDADFEFVRNKLNSLRTSFRKEYRKVEKSREEGTNDDEIYTPRLWYYDLLTFTADQDENSLSSSNLVTEITFEDDEASADSDKTYITLKKEVPTEYVIPQQENTLPDVSTTCRQKDPLSDNIIQTYKRRRTDQHQTADSSKLTSSPDDVFDAIGKNVAHKLRGMSEQQRIIAEKIISDVMYHGQMETLTTDFYLAESKCDSCSNL